MINPKFSDRNSRLFLKPLDSSHTDTFLAYRNDPTIALYQSWTPTYTKDDIINFIKKIESTSIFEPGKWNQIAWILKETNQHIGDLAFRTSSDSDQGELGFTLAQNFQHQGLATEAVKTFLNMVFYEQDFHRVFAFTDELNVKSYSLLERLNFRREGHFIENNHLKGVWGNEYFYAILQKEWKSSFPKNGSNN